MRSEFFNRRSQMSGGVKSSLSSASFKFLHVLRDGDDCSLSNLHHLAASLIFLMELIHPKFPIESEGLLMRYLDLIDARSYTSAAATYEAIARLVVEAGEDREKLVRTMIFLLAPLSAGLLIRASEV